LRDEFVHLFDAELHAGHPESVLIIAEATDAVFDVGLLKENGIAVLGAAGVLIFEAGGEIGAGIFVAVEAFVRGRERIVERFGARDETRLK
jgi:hypothetical protein